MKIDFSCNGTKQEGSACGEHVMRWLQDGLCMTVTASQRLYDGTSDASGQAISPPLESQPIVSLLRTAQTWASSEDHAPPTSRSLGREWRDLWSVHVNTLQGIHVHHNRLIIRATRESWA